MTDGSVFKIIYVAGMISMFVIRLAYRVRRGGGWPAEPRHKSLEAVLLGLAFVGMLVVPLAYVFTGAPGFADYRLPAWAGWAGTPVFLAALWLLRRSHADLGRNWSQTLELREGHELVTTGVYRRVRHPMYAALWLWGVAQPLILYNWVAGFSHLASFAALYFLRVPREERMMLDYFGAEYGAYMRRTGRVLPRLTPGRG